jgi:signal transduction histidine kinase
MSSTQAERISELEHEVAQLAQERQELFARLAAVECERAKHITVFAMAAHEISSPLQSLTLATDLMFDRISGSADESPRSWLLEHLAMQQQSLSRLHELLRTWLIAPELQAGMLVSQGARCDLADLVRAAAVRLAPDLSWAGCDLELQLQPIDALWDCRTVDTVLSNVIGNAIKYGARNPITVSLVRQERHAVIAVRDRGIGIARADRERIFDRLERGQGSAQVPGMGVGLWICRSLLRNIGGSIEVDGAPAGRGTVFSVRLPISE